MIPLPDYQLFDDTTDAHEQVKSNSHAVARTADPGTTADIDDATARHLVHTLVDGDIVTPVAGDRRLRHEPSGAAFTSITQLAVFHRGWTAARDTGETER